MFIRYLSGDTKFAGDNEIILLELLKRCLKNCQEGLKYVLGKQSPTKGINLEITSLKMLFSAMKIAEIIQVLRYEFQD